jgi:ATP-binding cassette subfamily F protein uup
VLDEPTNDLDMETLEVLEERLANFQGTLIVVSHDRQFLDNVVTSTIVFEEEHRIRSYVGGYSDWLRQGRKLEEIDKPGADRRGRQAAGATGGTRARKPSYREQQELEQLPGKIAELETELKQLEHTISADGFYSQPHQAVQTVLEKMTDTQARLDRAMERWTELDDRLKQYLAERP